MVRGRMLRAIRISDRICSLSRRDLRTGSGPRQLPGHRTRDKIPNMSHEVVAELPHNYIRVRYKPEIVPQAKGDLPLQARSESTLSQS